MFNKGKDICRLTKQIISTLSHSNNVYYSTAASALYETKLTNIIEKGGIREITMCHTKTRNALSLAMLNDLIKYIKSNENDPSLRCIIISAVGKVFSAGHDLKELDDTKGRSYHEEIFKICTKLMISILESPVPIIAKVDGLAAAAGCQLVAQCDMAVASDISTFSTPGANFGIFCSTPGIAVGRCVPKMTAMDMLLTGLPISADKALNTGLISRVVPSDQLNNEIEIVTNAICSKSREVIALGKKFYYKQMCTDIKNAYQLGEKVMVDNINLPNGQEGIKSFAEKRKPVWKDQ